MADTGKPISIRVREKEGQHRVDCLTTTSSVRELKAILFSLTGLQPRRILCGYPPVALNLDDDDMELQETQLRSGDTLILETGGAPQPSESSNKGSASTVQQQNRVDNEMNNSHPDVGDISVPGILMRRVVPANNSCLFTSVFFGISGGKYENRAGTDLRQIIAEAVARDPIQYNEAFLGKPNREYCTWILNEDHWGGAIELAILSKHFQVEIVAVDTQNVRLNRFGEDETYSKRILVIYDGIHYDPLMLEGLDGSGEVRTVFDIDDAKILVMALELANEAKLSRQFTDVQNFTLRCLVCNRGFVGQAAAQSHAKTSGHTNFSET